MNCIFHFLNYTASFDSAMDILFFGVTGNIAGNSIAMIAGEGFYSICSG